MMKMMGGGGKREWEGMKGWREGHRISSDSSLHLRTKFLSIVSLRVLDQFPGQRECPIASVLLAWWEVSIS